MPVNWFTSEGWLEHLGSPIVAFILLLVISHLIYIRLFSHQTPSLMSGSIWMALGVFALDALRQLGFPYFYMLYVVLEILIIGLYLGLNLLQGVMDDEINIKDPTEELAIGTWITAAVMSVILLNQIEKTLLGFVALISIVAFSLFAYYLYVIAHWYYLYLHKKTRVQVNGNLLLSAISFQAIGLLLLELFHDNIHAYVYVALVIVGLVLYVCGIICIASCVYTSRSRRVTAGWSNEITLAHAALSMAGLAMINTQAFPDWAIHAIWCVTLIVFVSVELGELLRLTSRCKLKNLSQAIGIYHNSQWIRIFAFGIFYSFILNYYQYEYSTDTITTMIVSYGQYVVAILLVAEICILLKYISQKGKA